jgi:hypothetical protein
MSTLVLRCPQCGSVQRDNGECVTCREAAVRYYCPNHTPGRWLVAPSCPDCGATFHHGPKHAGVPDVPGAIDADRDAPGTVDATDVPFTIPPMAPPPLAPPPVAPPPVAPPAPTLPPPRPRVEPRVVEPRVVEPRVVERREIEPRERTPRGMPMEAPPIPDIIRVGVASAGSCLMRLFIIALVLVALAAAAFFWVVRG